MAAVVAVGDLEAETLGAVEVVVEDVAEAGEISRTSLFALLIAVDEEVLSSMGDEETSVVISAVAVEMAAVEVIIAAVENSVVAAVVVVLKALESSSKSTDSQSLCVIFCIWIG